MNYVKQNKPNMPCLCGIVSTYKSFDAYLAPAGFLGIGFDGGTLSLTYVPLETDLIPFADAPEKCGSGLNKIKKQLGKNASIRIIT